ncbi:prenyltransferase/squalene oxidase repeat-containing protein [Bythopirellula polymerisocia]|nr:prenyltransferase/squalene oxidase repeat-containing protein [Bythopirellula polymerisocia]
MACCQAIWIQQAQAAATEEASRISKLVDSAVGFLVAAQDDDGSFSKDAGTGVTSLVATALLRNGYSPEEPLVAKSLAYLRQFVQPDGGIYQPGSTHRNYETCIAVVAFHEANTDGKYDKLIANAESFIKGEQWDQAEGIEPSQEAYGGSGYGSHSRPDLSNTSFLIDTLHTLGRGDDDPAIQRALIFVSRCQNLATKYNDTKYADLNPDGGFYYTIAAGGSSQAGSEEDGGLRSYGSMTYAGLKSMIFAGVKANDPRVKAAFEWAQKNYTLGENPGMGDSGLFYYYHTFAKSLDAIGEQEFVDDSGKSHDWREELVAEFAERQQPDGSWVNSNVRWLEGDPNLVTGYALLALSYCR